MRLNRVVEVADILAVHKMKVYQMISSGELKATRIGRAVRISDAELERFVAAHTAGAGSKK